MNKHFSLCATMTRAGTLGGPVECYVVLSLSITHYHPGSPGSYWEPPDSLEFEFRFDGARFDGDEPDDAPGPLTEAECEALEARLDGDLLEAAFERAIEIMADDGPDPDRLRDQMIDDRMMGVR